MSALSAATGNDEFISAATECLAYEDSTYDVAQRGWADLRETADAAFPCKWCYGAPGIGLARIAMTKLAGVPVSSYAHRHRTRAPPAWNVIGRCRPTPCAAGRSAVSNSCGRQPTPSAATTCVCWEPGSSSPLSGPLVPPTITAGAAEPVDSTSACSVDSPGSDTRCCGEHDPTLPNVLIWE